MPASVTLERTMTDTLLKLTDAGLYCPVGDFYIDPWGSVPRAIITHAHSDHARSGSAQYLAVRESLPLLEMRLGPDAMIHTMEYGDSQLINGAHVSFHPAGHMLGSAQIRIEARGQVAVVTGDFKWGDDPTCRAFEPLRCHLLVMESTFALPIYRWPEVAAEREQIIDWWQSNQQQGKTSVLLVYAIGKAQRMLTMVQPAIGPIYAHGAVRNGCHAYRAAGVDLPEVLAIADAPPRMKWSDALILAPPLAHNSPWLRRFGRVSVAAVSGWMRIRGIRRRRTIDRGFVVSDHADWDGLLRAVEQCAPERIWATHGYSSTFAHYLQQQGYNAEPISTRFEGEPLEVRESDIAEEPDGTTASDAEVDDGSATAEGGTA